MNFYDKVHEMTKALKEREEYSKYIELKEEIKKDEELKNKISSFKSEQMELQRGLMTTGKLDEEKKKELQDKYADLINNSKVKEYFEMEIRLDILLADMQKIIADSLRDLYEI